MNNEHLIFVQDLLSMCSRAFAAVERGAPLPPDFVAAFEKYHLEAKQILNKQNDDPL